MFPDHDPEILRQAASATTLENGIERILGLDTSKSVVHRRPVPQPRSGSDQVSGIYDAVEIVDEGNSNKGCMRGVSSGRISALDSFMECPPPADDALLGTRKRNNPSRQSGLYGWDASYRNPDRSEQEPVTSWRPWPIESPDDAGPAITSYNLHSVPAPPSPEFSGFDGLDLSDQSEEEMAAPPPDYGHTAYQNSDHGVGRAIPPTDHELRGTVEDLVQSFLLRDGRPGSGHSDDSASVASNMSAETLSNIVSSTVDRLLSEKYDLPRKDGVTPIDRSWDRDAGSWPRSEPQENLTRTSTCDGNRNRGSNGSLSSASSSPQRGVRLSEGSYRMPGLSCYGTPSCGSFDIDDDYITGISTMDQLRTDARDLAARKPMKISAKAVARDRIRRLASGRGRPIAGVRIGVRRDADGSFGFSVSGESPVFVHSIVRNGPADIGVDGLFEGDVILKVGSELCAKSSREHVVLQLQRQSRDVSIVVARTPPLQRKDPWSSPPKTRSASESNAAGHWD